MLLIRKDGEKVKRDRKTFNENKKINFSPKIGAKPPIKSIGGREVSLTTKLTK